MALKASHLATDVGIDEDDAWSSAAMFRTELRVACYIYSSEKKWDDGYCPLLGFGRAEVHLHTELSQDHRLVLALPLGLALDRWWPEFVRRLNEDKRQAALLCIARSLMDEFALVHMDQIVHLDVKPSNILMLPDSIDDIDSKPVFELIDSTWSMGRWRPVLSDFGGVSCLPHVASCYPLPPQRHFGSPLYKRTRGTAVPFYDVESLVLSLLATENPGSEEPWRLGKTAGCSLLATSKDLWNLPSRSPWYKYVRERVVSQMDTFRGTLMYPEAAEFVALVPDRCHASKRESEAEVDGQDA